MQYNRTDQNEVTTIKRNNDVTAIQQQRENYNQTDGSILNTSPEDQGSITSNNTIVRSNNPMVNYERSDESNNGNNNNDDDAKMKINRFWSKAAPELQK